MATGTIQGFGKTETACTGLVTGVTYNANRLTKINGISMIHFEFAISSANNIATGAALGVVESGWYPAGGKSLPAIIIASDNAVYAGLVNISTTGNVYQSTTSSCRKIYVDGWYPI